MKMQDHFDAAPWLTETERKLALGLLRKYRRHALRKGEEDSPALTLELADQIVHWLLLQRMQTAAITMLGALPEDAALDARNAAIAQAGALLEQIARIRNSRAAVQQDETSGEEEPVQESIATQEAAPAVQETPPVQQETRAIQPEASARAAHPRPNRRPSVSSRRNFLQGAAPALSAVASARIPGAPHGILQRAAG